MNKKIYLTALSVLVAGCITAQTLPDGMVALLPTGVKAAIDGAQRKTAKDLIVAGTKTAGYKAYFAATDEDHGQELWVTDGTPDGTKLVKDINPGSASSDITYLTRFNDKVVFAADDGTNGSELWISDGTEAGTVMLKDINEFGDSYPSAFTQVNEHQFIFCAKTYDSENYDPDFGEQKWLWVSDGTADGTKQIKDCKVDYPGAENANYTEPFMRVGRKVFFKGDTKDTDYGSELWVTDGTTDGTYLVKDINTQAVLDESGNPTKKTRTSAIDNMCNYYNREVYFKAWSPEYGNEPWASDGTAEGTHLICDTWPGFDADGNPYGQSCGAEGGPYRGYVYYRAYSVDLGYELGRTDLEAGNHEIFDINKHNESTDLDIRSSYPDFGTVFDDTYCFTAYTGFDTTIPDNHGGELYYFDDTNNTWGEITDTIFTANNSDWARDLTVCAGSMYWWNDDGPTGHKNKLWRVDGHLAHPVQVTDLVPGGADLINTPRNLNGTLLICQQIETGNQRIYAYKYRKAGYDAVRDSDVMDPVFDPIPINWRNGGVNKVNSDNSAKLKIYPNPTSDYFNFSANGEANNVKVFDLTGRLVKIVANPMGSISVSNLSAGMYKVMVTTNTGTYVSSLIVK
jgi:ELWxxDGT repeat protein